MQTGYAFKIAVHHDELERANRRLMEVNRQLRNLIAANVSARLDTLTGAPPIYRAGNSPRSAYSYAAARV